MLRLFAQKITLTALLAPIAAFSLVGAPFVLAQTQDGGKTGEADVSPLGSGQEILPPGVTTATTYPNTNVPRIYPRSVWEGFEYASGSWKPVDTLRTLLTWLPQADNQPPDYTPVDRIIVHDQGCLNPTTCTANAEKYPIQTIQGVFRSHAVTRGWGDIGYNFIIDRQGRIFEGRYGGNGVRAAHIYVGSRCENLNVGSIGVLLLGDLRSGPMTQAQSDSLGRLAAWTGSANGVDMSETVVTTTTWRNPRTPSGSCDVSQGGFTGSLTAARLVSHGDVEGGNSDFFSLDTQRLASATLRESYIATTYRMGDDSRTYALRDGVLQETIGAPTTVALIERTQLELFPTASASTLPDGSLVKSRTRSRVYVIEQGQRRSIPSADLFEARGYRWDAIREISDRELALWRIGYPIPYPDGAVVKGAKAEVYVFESGQLRHITSASLFNALKYVWSSIRNLLDSDVEQYPKGDPKRFPDGTLVKGFAPRVYKIENGARRAVFSASLFSILGLRWEDIQTLDEQELNRYPEGTTLVWPDGTLIRAQGQERIYLVQGGFRRWIQTADVFKSLGYAWSAVRVLDPAELTEIPEAQPIGVLADRNQTPQAVQPPSFTQGQEPLTRIGLAIVGAGSDKHIPTIVDVSYDSGATVKKNGSILATLSPQQRYTFTPAVGETWRIEPTATTGIATVHSYTDPGWSIGSNDNRFRGAIEVKTGTNNVPWLINELKIEDYLKGIAETINGDPAEYGKAFAIAARTYAFNYIQKGGKRAEEPFHIRRTSADQLYKGYNFELRAADPVAAATATRGMIAMFNDKPIVAAYSSGAPGPTKSACEAVSQAYCNNPDYAYLAGGVNDPPDTEYGGLVCGVNGNHCAGMDARGGRRMAELGSTAENILKTYYPGIVILSQW